jgi:hypothetical protein
MTGDVSWAYVEQALAPYRSPGRRSRQPRRSQAGGLREAIHTATASLRYRIGHAFAAFPNPNASYGCELT